MGVKLRIKLLKNSIRRWWSQVRWGIRIDLEYSMLPSVGKGKYVDVLIRGKCIEIKSHDNPESLIRLIPYQPNHGVMIESVGLDGRCNWRTHCDYDMFLKMGCLGCEQLKRKGK